MENVLREGRGLAGRDEGRGKSERRGVRSPWPISMLLGRLLRVRPPCRACFQRGRLEDAVRRVHERRRASGVGRGRLTVCGRKQDDDE